MPNEQELIERLAALEAELQTLKAAAPVAPVSVIEQSRRQTERNQQALRLPMVAPVQTQALSRAMQSIQVGVRTAWHAMAVYRVRYGYWPDPQRLTLNEVHLLQIDARALAAAQPLVDWPPNTPTDEVFSQFQQEARALNASLEQAEGILAKLLKNMPWALRNFWEQRYGALRTGRK
jgi:hypothetical protein